MRRVSSWGLILAIAPVALVIAYMQAQDVVRVRLDALGERMQTTADSWAASKRDDALSGPGRSGPLHDFEMAFGEVNFLSGHVAPRLLPRGLGVALGAWAALVLGSLLGWHRETGWSSRSTGRVWKLAAPHAVGILLTALGLTVVALVGADLNASWDWVLPTALAGLGSPAVVPQLGVVVRAAAPLAVGAMLTMLGARILFTGLRGPGPQPFLRLSRARVWSLGVAVVGAALVVFAVASVEIYRSHLSALVRESRVITQGRGYFDYPLDSETATKFAAWTGLALATIGLVASVVIPMRLRRRPGSLAGARECVDCAHPLLKGQSTCPECGAVH